MNVTAVTPLDKRRCKVFLDEDFALVLYKGEIRRYQIEDGSSLTEEEYGEILTILSKRAKERALFLLKDSDKTEKEIRKKLTEGLYPAEIIDHTIDFLKKYRFVDDQSYGERYIASYSSRRSRLRITFDLQQKGLPKDLVDRLFEECPVEEEQPIEVFLRKKQYNKDTATPQEKQKLAAALGRKGFSFECIRRVMGGEAE